MKALKEQHSDLIEVLIDEMMMDTPHRMIDNLLTVMNGFFDRHYGDEKLTAKDLFIISRYMHIFLCAMRGFDEEDIRKSMEEVLPMTDQEEFEYFKTLVELEEIMEV